MDGLSAGRGLYAPWGSCTIDTHRPPRAHRLRTEHGLRLRSRHTSLLRGRGLYDRSGLLRPLDRVPEMGAVRWGGVPCGRLCRMLDARAVLFILLPPFLLHPCPARVALLLDGL